MISFKAVTNTSVGDQIMLSLNMLLWHDYFELKTVRNSRSKKNLFAFPALITRKGKSYQEG